MKGPRAWLLPRAWVSFLLDHPVATAFRAWAKHSLNSEEFIFQESCANSDCHGG